MINLNALQTLLPHHLLTRLAGRLANATTPCFKNWLIRRFMKQYNINLNEALIKHPEAFATFNDFFIRKLEPSARPICKNLSDLACPVDGTVAQIGNITRNRLIQAKGHDYTLEALLGGDQPLANAFTNGSFATLYLAPHNYHRIHMPVNGTLEQSIFVPGRLFSVNENTTAVIPRLFARNERLITVFNTEAGPMAVILVGAMIVGSIQTAWMQEAFRAKQLTKEIISQPITLKKGEELGYFKLGSTVILLFGKDRIQWNPALAPNKTIHMGESIGAISF